MNFDQDPRFKQELKKLSRKYKNLAEDLKTFCRVHGLIHGPQAGDSPRRNLFAGNNASCLHGGWSSKNIIVKARLDSSDLDSKMVRVVYHLNPEESTITLLEIYVKNQKSNEDTKRWREYV